MLISHVSNSIALSPSRALLLIALFIYQSFCQNLRFRANRALWSRTAKNRDVSTRLFTCIAWSFACSVLLATLARSTALVCLLACSFTHSRARGKVTDQMSENTLVLSHGAIERNSMYAREQRGSLESISHRLNHVHYHSNSDSPWVQLPSINPPCLHPILKFCLSASLC